jgi:hypothetical protein
MRNNRKLDKLRKRQVSQEKKIWKGGKKENEGVCGVGKGGGRRGKGQNINIRG